MTCFQKSLRKKQSLYLRLPRSFQEPSESSALVNRAKKMNAYANLLGTFRVKRSCQPQFKEMLTPTFREPSESNAVVNLKNAYANLPRSFREPSESSALLCQTQKSCFRGASANLPSQARPWVKPKKVASEELPRLEKIKQIN